LKIIPVKEINLLDLQFQIFKLPNQLSLHSTTQSMKVTFTPGPSQLYFTVEAHLKQAIKQNIGSISHRSKEFEVISKEATEGLRQLLSIPQDFHVFFMSSATEVWERSIQNLVADSSFHFVNGAFSKRYYEIAGLLGKHPTRVEATLGKGFDTNIETPDGTELIAVTHNETSTGVSVPMDYINSLRDKHKDALIVVDAVSSLPFPQFDYSKIDSVFFSVQKGFGLPAGLGVWIVNNRCIAKAESLQSKGFYTGSYHSLQSLLMNAKKHQTPGTPNVLGIFLLGQIIKDFLSKGIQTIKNETEYKAAVLYNCLDNHPTIKAFVDDKNWRSKTVIVANTGAQTESITKALSAKGFFPGDGYGELKKSQLRFANFPAHSKEQFECLVDLLNLIQ
jgi:phosphoserine aminotransferase